MIKCFQRVPFAFSWVLLIFTLLQGCSQKQIAVEIPLGPNHSYQLESPASFGGSFSATQKLLIDTKNEHKEMIVHVEINPQQLQIIAFGLLGITVFQLNWDGQNLEVIKPHEAIMPFAPEYMIADLQLALWSKFPANPGLMLQDQPNKRIISSGDKPIIIIDYPQGKQEMSEIIIHYVNKGYRLQIKRLDEEN